MRHNEAAAGREWTVGSGRWTEGRVKWADSLDKTRSPRFPVHCPLSTADRPHPAASLQSGRSSACKEQATMFDMVPSIPDIEVNFDGYNPEAFYDEMFSAPGIPRPEAAELVNRIKALDAG